MTTTQLRARLVPHATVEEGRGRGKVSLRREVIKVGVEDCDVVLVERGFDPDYQEHDFQPPALPSRPSYAPAKSLAFPHRLLNKDCCRLKVT